MVRLDLQVGGIARLSWASFALNSSPIHAHARIYGQCRYTWPIYSTTRTLERKKYHHGVEKECDPTEVTGNRAPLLTMIDEGPDGGGW